MVAFLALDDPQPPQIRCSVDAEHGVGSVMLRGRIASSVETAGHYRLEIIKAGQSGSSNIVQSGAFQVKANEPGFFGSANLSAGPATSLIARFTVQVAGGEGQCAAERVISDE